MLSAASRSASGDRCMHRSMWVQSICPAAGMHSKDFHRMKLQPLVDPSAACSAAHANQQPNTSCGFFLCLKLPPPPCAAPLLKHQQGMRSTIIMDTGFVDCNDLMPFYVNGMMISGQHAITNFVFRRNGWFLDDFGTQSWYVLLGTSYLHIFYLTTSINIHY